LRFGYDRDETFRLLMRFAVVLMMEDAIRMTWATAPRSTGGLSLAYGQVRILGATAPIYNLIVIAASLAIALAIGWLLTRTAFGGSSAPRPTTATWPRRSASTCAVSTRRSSRSAPRWAPSVERSSSPRRRR